jgi:hypothetical protein
MIELNDPAVVRKELNSVVNIAAVAGVVMENFISNNLTSSNLLFFGKENYEEKFVSKFSKNLFFDILAFPFRKYSVKIKKAMVTGSEMIIGESLKLSKESLKEIETITFNYDNLKRVIDEGLFERLSVGLILRNIGMKYLTQIIIIAICEDYCEYAISIKSEKKEETILEEVDLTILTELIQKYEKFCKYVLKENLKDIENLKPILRVNDQFYRFRETKFKIYARLKDLILRNL